MRNRDILKLALLAFVQPDTRRRGKRAFPEALSNTEPAAVLLLRGLTSIIAQPRVYDADVVLAELRQRNDNWRPYQADDELMDGKPITSFSLDRNGRYVGTVRYISIALRQGYLASAFGVGTLNELDAEGKYQPLPLADAASLIEERLPEGD